MPDELTLFKVKVSPSPASRGSVKADLGLIHVLTLFKLKSEPRIWVPHATVAGYTIMSHFWRQETRRDLLGSDAPSSRPRPSGSTFSRCSNSSLRPVSLDDTRRPTTRGRNDALGSVRRARTSKGDDRRLPVLNRL